MDPQFYDKKVYTNVAPSPGRVPKQKKEPRFAQAAGALNQQEDRVLTGTGNVTNELTLENKSSATKNENENDMAEEIEFNEQPSELTILDQNGNQNA